MRYGLALVCAFSLALGQAQADGDNIWGALVLATKETPAQPIPTKLGGYAPTIERVFGYNSLYLLGEKKTELIKGGQEWLIPSKEFFFQIRYGEREKARYLLHIDLYRKDTLLITTDVRLARDAPLYIRGPEWGKGQLILLLEVR